MWETIRDLQHFPLQVGNACEDGRLHGGNHHKPVDVLHDVDQQLQRIAFGMPPNGMNPCMYVRVERSPTMNLELVEGLVGVWRSLDGEILHHLCRHRNVLGGHFGFERQFCAELGYQLI